MKQTLRYMAGKSPKPWRLFMGNFFLQKKVGVSIAMFDDWLVIYFQWDDSPQLLADFEDVFFFFKSNGR
jgi:hypothetical protein